MENDLLYKVGLTLVPGIGPVQAKILLQHFEVAELFKAKQSQLEKIEGIGSIRARSIKTFNGFSKAATELKFIEERGIKPLFISDPHYPRRLLNCYDSPTLLFYKGTANLNTGKVVAIIGTRNNSEYGKQLTEKLISELAEHDILVVSGLAFGIDAIAHKAALKHDLSTIGVLAHGLDQVYPFGHAGLAKDMIRNKGGLITEFHSNTAPDRHHFPTRNRIVAGMSDAIVVVETGIKGGSMITAELANGYNKDVFAYPGRITDPKSIGCNQLVRNNKAVLLTDAQELIESMGWMDNRQSAVNSQQSAVGHQRELFTELTVNEKIIIGILQTKKSVHIDEIYFKSGLSASSLAAAILSLELHNIISSLPGKVYQAKQ